MDYDNICISCFREKEDDVCPKCGYIEPQKRRKSVLPAKWQLNDRYIIGEVIGVDKASVEYKAWDIKEKRIVEIQEYYPREFVTRDSNGLEITVSSQENQDTFRKNVSSILSSAQKMLELSSSPYIVDIFDCFEGNNTVYVVKEYLEGMFLNDFIDSNGGKVDTETAVSIIVPVLEGLSQIHKAGLVHRAISPKSIIITVDNEIKIGNFRFLKDASPYKDENMTVHFSAGYAPPEQYRTKSKQGAFSDIYSVGAVLYKMLTGEKPLDALERMGSDNIISPRSINPDIPENVNISIMKAMNMTSELRFKTAVDFKNSLLAKKDVVDIDNELKNIKHKKFNQTTVLLLAVLAAVTVFVLYKFLG